MLGSRLGGWHCSGAPAIARSAAAIAAERVFDCDLQLERRRDRRAALAFRPQALLAALRRLGVALGYRIFQNEQDPIGCDAAISGCHSVDPSRSFEPGALASPKQNA